MATTWGYRSKEQVIPSRPIVIEVFLKLVVAATFDISKSL